jgi:dienelactone hydrolase
MNTRIKSLVSALVVLASARAVLAVPIAIDVRTFEYGMTEKFDGYIAAPKKLKGPLPAVLIIHNWMGLSEETKKQTRRFAEMGYVAMAVDVYGRGQRPKDAAEAGKFAGKYKGDRKLLRERLNLALARLLEEKNVNKGKVAAAGYCFGGTAAIELARSGAAIKGVVSFHGGLDSPTPAEGQNIKAKVLLHHGAIDPYVAAKDVEALEAEFGTYKVDYQLIKYGGTVHSFTEEGAGTDISKGAAYNKLSEQRSFTSTKSFLQEIFAD